VPTVWPRSTKSLAAVQRRKRSFPEGSQEDPSTNSNLARVVMPTYGLGDRTARASLRPAAQAKPCRFSIFAGRLASNED
jgi:hypothetical protein